MTSFDHRKGDNNDQSRQECCAFTGAFFSSHGSDAHKRELEAQAHESAMRRKMACCRPHHRLHIISGHRRGHSVPAPKQYARRDDACQG